MRAESRGTAGATAGRGRRRSARLLPALVATLLAALLCAAAAVTATPARAETTPIATGHLDWILKESFDNYAGHGVPGDGATRNADHSFRFALVSGSFDSETNTTLLQFAGSVHWKSHCDDSGFCALDVKIADPRVELTPSGSDVYLDMVSRHESTYQLVSYPDANLARMSIRGIAPVIADGTTTWSAVPTTLTAMGVAPFAGFYQAGQALSPLSFTYAGPGGVPLPEPWTAAGTPAYTPAAPVAPAEALPGGIRRVFPDDAHGLFHVVARAAGGASVVQAYDRDTRLPAGPATTVADTSALSDEAVAFDPAAGTVFVGRSVSGQTSFAALTWSGGAYAQTAIPTGTRIFGRTLYDPHSQRLIGLPSLFSLGTPGVTLRRSGGGWSAYDSAWPFGGAGRDFRDVVVTTAGDVIAATVTPTPSAPADFASLRVAAFGGLTATAVSGQEDLGPWEHGASGFVFAAAGPDNSAYLAEDMVPGRIVKVRKTVEGEWVVGGSPIETRLTPSALGVDTGDETVYLATADTGADGSTLTILRGGETVRTLALEADARQVAVAAEGDVYLHDGDRVLAIDRAGASPAIAAQPQDAVVEIAQPGATVTATFTAAATGTPAPAVRWQQHVPGSGWQPVPDATTETLTVAASDALNGRRYRAVFENAAGALATSAATLSVSVAPPGRGPETPPETRPGEPEPQPKPPVLRSQPPRLSALALTATRLSARFDRAGRARVLIARERVRKVRRGGKVRTVRAWTTVRTVTLTAMRAATVRRSFARLPAGRYRLTATPLATDGRRGATRTAVVRVKAVR